MQISIYPYIYHRTLTDIEYCQKHGIAVQAYEVSSSLLRASEKGEWIGPWSSSALILCDRIDGPLDPVVNSIAAELKVTPGQVLLQWAASKGFAVVTTTSKPSRMDVGWFVLLRVLS